MSVKDVGLLLKKVFNDLIGRNGWERIPFGIIAFFELPFLIIIALMGKMFFDGDFDEVRK